MATSMDQALDEAIVQVVKAAKEITNGTVRQVSVDCASSADYPYRVFVPDEQLPIVGLATRD